LCWIGEQRRQGGVRAVLFKQEIHTAEPQTLAVLKLTLSDGLSVNKRAVGGIQIGQPEPVSGDLKPAVQARNGSVRNADGIVGSPPDFVDPRFEVIHLGAVGARVQDEAWHQ
jgi:hypothetical protein